MIKWRQHLSFLPSLASSLGVTSYTQEVLSCGRTCSPVPGTSLIRITGRKTGAGLECLKISLRWSLQAKPWNSRSHVKPDSGSLSSWIWASGVLCVWPSGRAGWDISVLLALGVHPVWQRWTLDWVFSGLLLKSQSKGKERGQCSSSEHPSTAPCLMWMCWAPSKIAPAALVSAVVWFVWVSPPLVAWPVWQ